MEKSKFMQWYSENREDFNKKRRERYKNDASYRDARLKKSRGASRRVMHRDGLITIFNGNVPVEVYTSGVLSKMIGISPTSIRLLERSGVLPRPTIESAHRYYTENQAQVAKEIVGLRKRFLKSEIVKEEFESELVNLHNKWSN